MLDMKFLMAHVPCVIRKLNELLDPDWEEGREPMISIGLAAPDLLEVLEEIAKGEGAFSRDPLTHCSNTVESMKKIALAAIAKTKGGK